MDGAIWITMGIVLVLAAGLGLGLWWRGRVASRRGPKRPRKLQNPIVLAHGIMGFDELKLAGVRQDYFRGVPERLRQMGAEVHVVRVPASASIRVRAEELARAVSALSAKRVNIVAHSMGGLDARYAISRLGLAAKVASLTTIGTPHRGTPLADLSAKVLGEGAVVRRLISALGVDVSALDDLTTQAMDAFNREVPDAKGVSYGSYLASIQGKLFANPLLLPAHLYLRERAGNNDGLVTEESQRWGEILGAVDADHWAQIGWSTRFDAPVFYAELLRTLTQRGF
jgi:triacylglycerol lipase